MDEVQQAVARYLEILVKRTTTKVTFSGLDELDPENLICSFQITEISR